MAVDIDHFPAESFPLIMQIGDAENILGRACCLDLVPVDEGGEVIYLEIRSRL